MIKDVLQNIEYVWLEQIQEKSIMEI